MGNFLISEKSLLTNVGRTKILNGAALPYLEVRNSLSRRSMSLQKLQAKPPKQKLQLLLHAKYDNCNLEVMRIYPIDWMADGEKKQPVGFIVEAQRDDEQENDEQENTNITAPDFARCLWLDVSGVKVSEEKVAELIDYVMKLETPTQQAAGLELPLDFTNFGCHLKWFRFSSPESDLPTHSHVNSGLENGFAANSRVDGDTSSQELFRQPVEQSAVEQGRPVGQPAVPTFSTVEQSQRTILPHSGEPEYPIFSNR